MQKEYKDKIYRFFEDPGHGWLEVHEAEIENLNIKDKITSCSYYDKKEKLVYLEEDCDAPLFIKTYCKEYNMPENNFKNKINFIYKDTIPFRYYDRYNTKT